MQQNPNGFFNHFEECVELMSPKVDFVFKLLFGDENHKELLIAFLQSVLRLSKERPAQKMHHHQHLRLYDDIAKQTA